MSGQSPSHCRRTSSRLVRRASQAQSHPRLTPCSLSLCHPGTCMYRAAEAKLVYPADYPRYTRGELLQLCRRGVRRPPGMPAFKAWFGYVQSSVSSPHLQACLLVEPSGVVHLGRTLALAGRCTWRAVRRRGSLRRGRGAEILPHPGPSSSSAVPGALRAPTAGHTNRTSAVTGGDGSVGRRRPGGELVRAGDRLPLSSHELALAPNRTRPPIAHWQHRSTIPAHPSFFLLSRSCMSQTRTS